MKVSVKDAFLYYAANLLYQTKESDSLSLRSSIIHLLRSQRHFEVDNMGSPFYGQRIQQGSHISLYKLLLGGQGKNRGTLSLFNSHPVAISEPDGSSRVETVMQSILALMHVDSTDTTSLRFEKAHFSVIPRSAVLISPPVHSWLPETTKHSTCHNASVVDANTRGQTLESS